MFEYFTKYEAELFTFYRIPKELFTHPKYKKMSEGAKILYGLLLDRNGLSRQNEWFDKNGHVYIYFSREEVMEMLGVSKTTAIKWFDELKEAELIREVRQGQGKPNIIYVGKFVTASPCKSTEVQKLDFKKSRISTSESPKTGPQKVQKMDPNNTQLNRSYRERLNNTHPAIENSSKFEVIAPSKTEGVCVNQNHSKINENIQELPIEEIKELQEEIEKTTTHKVQVKKIRELLANSSIERIRYHLENWHIHKEHQKFEGAGWFFTVIQHDIAPEKKITGGTGEKNGNIPLKDNFPQRQYTKEQYDYWQNAAVLETANEIAAEAKEKNSYTYVEEEEEKEPEIPYIERKGYI